jgi:hypothetical protein
MIVDRADDGGRRASCFNRSIEADTRVRVSRTTMAGPSADRRRLEDFVRAVATAAADELDAVVIEAAERHQRAVARVLVDALDAPVATRPADPRDAGDDDGWGRRGHRGRSVSAWLEGRVFALRRLL